MAETSFPDYSEYCIFWFRRDLRLHDNVGLSHALKSGKKVIPLFIFDKNILDELPTHDRRVSFLYDRLGELRQELKNMQSDLWVYYGTPEQFFKNIKSYSVYTNKDYEPYATERDAMVSEILNERGIIFQSFKDQVIFEEDEIRKKDGGIYTVFTPYSKTWKKQYEGRFAEEALCDTSQWAQVPLPEIPTLQDMGFTHSNYILHPIKLNTEQLHSYEALRDRVDGNHTTNLSVYLRFGLVSPREVIRITGNLSEKLIDELIWREFYSMILWNFPHVVLHNFRREYDKVPWRNDPEEFEKWKDGTTGYSMVDAGMRELKETGYISNRARMVAAGFLTKHLLTHWSYGEAYFAEKLMDYDLASNNGNWQWAAGTGCDAAPYFRIFNPMTQQKKFDPDYQYVHTWVKEWGTDAYPSPMVDHTWARETTLEAFKEKDKHS